MLILKLVMVALLNNRHLILVAAIFAMGMLVGVLIVVPTMTDEAEAGCKPKKNKIDFTTSEDYS
jgi:hypothetical protein